MISNKYIDSILFHLIRKFGGTFSSDDSPNLSNEVNSIICNFSKRGARGSHFVAFMKRKNDILYIDSLNTSYSMLPDDIKIWMKKQKIKRFSPYYKYQVQDISSTYCGFYCILALLQETYPTITPRIKLNRQRLLLNDDKCIKLILKIISGIKTIR